MDRKPYISPDIVPEGYRRVRWSEVSNGDRVFLNGRQFGQPHAMGPYRVHNKNTRALFSEFMKNLIKNSTHTLLVARGS